MGQKRDYSEAFKENNIPVVFSTDDNYVPYLCVALRSLVEHANVHNNYDIFIMCKQLTKKSIENIECIINTVDNFSVRILDVSEYMQNRSLFTANEKKEAYLSEETYYRLLLPDILINYNKVVYLDCDIAVMTDIGILFQTEMDGYLIAAVRDMCGNYLEDMKSPDDYRQSILHIQEKHDYFNAGVLVLNLEEIRKYYKEFELISLATSREWKKHDQDILNMIAVNKTKFLPYAWNLIECSNEIINESMTQKDRMEYEVALKNPYLIHFAARKPWKYMDVDFMEEFWKNASNTPYFRELLNTLTESRLCDVSEIEKYTQISVKNHHIGIKFLIKLIGQWFRVKIG